MAGITSGAELDTRLAQAWSLCRRGGGGVIVLLGDPGIGKSSALSWLADHIGAAAHTISCRGGDVGTPMSTAAEFASALSGPDSAQLLSAEVDPLRAAEVLCTGLENTRAAALLVDDIHEADPSSRTALNLALRRAIKVGVLVVITGRRVPSARAFAEGFDVEELEGLEPAAAAAVLQSASAVPIASSVVPRLLQVAAGNPLALRHLPGALRPEQLSGAELLPDEIPLVGDLRTVFTRQLPLPHSPARELLDLAAVSADGSWAVLSALRPAIAARALEELENAGLAGLDRGRLVLQHPLLRSAARAAMPGHRWRELNLELADVPSLPDGVRLAHRARGTVGPDEELVDDLVDAARIMRIRGGTDAAARLLDRAVDLTGSDLRRGQLRLQAAELLSVAGEAEAARHRLEAVLDDPASRELHVSATLTLATLEAVNGAPVRAHHRLTECLATATPAEIGVVHARMALPLGMLGLVAQIAAAAEAAVAHSKPDTPEREVARIILAHAASAQDEARANELVDDLLEHLDLASAVQHDPIVGLHIGRALSIAERCDTAAVSALTRLSGQLRGEGARLSLAMTFGALGETSIRASRFDEALLYLDEAIALSLATGQRAFAPFWLGLRARVHAIRGDDASCAADLDLGFAISDEQSTFGARYFLLANAGLAAVAAQRYDEAITHLGECWAFEQAGGLLAPQLARWHVDLVEAYVESGRGSDAEPLVAHLTAVAAVRASSRWTKATARRAQALATAGSDPGRALELLDDAVSIYDPKVDAFDRARTLLDRARLSQEPDSRERARVEALYAFRRLGAAPWAARLASGVQPSETDGLTESEKRILTEVAKGLTNQQIAKRLRVSAKTVSNHLYHAYRKLGVSSRTEAARYVLLQRGQ